MTDHRGSKLPPGRQPYDPLNGLRVGALAGALLGAVVAAVTGAGWLILVGAIVGAIAGYVRERSALRHEADDPPEFSDDAT